MYPPSVINAIPIAVTVALFIAAVPSALACSVRSIPIPVELVRLADVIVRARAERLAPEPGRPGSLAASPTQVEFRIVALLKGTLPADRITFNGSFTGRDEPNRDSVPYVHVRPSGSGECFAVGYRRGAEYLLFLKRASHRAYAQPDQLTPYWAPLAPSNEQVFGAGDRWEAWVRAQLGRPDR
jgi:hypothetical protein